MSHSEEFMEVTLFSWTKRRSQDDWTAAYFHQGFAWLLNLTEKGIMSGS